MAIAANPTIVDRHSATRHRGFRPASIPFASQATVSRIVHLIARRGHVEDSVQAANALIFASACVGVVA
jgi:hypothetical protein